MLPTLYVTHSVKFQFIELHTQQKIYIFIYLKGESSSQACRSYMIVNVIVKDRQNFFFHFMIPPSAGGLPGQFVLA